MYLPAIQIGFTAFPGVEAFVATDFVNDTDQQFFFITQGDADTVRGDIVDIVGGPIQRVYQPAIVFVSQAAAAFFGDEACFGKQGGELGDQPFFRFLVDIRYVIVSTFFFYTCTVELTPFFFQESPGFAGYLLYLGTKFF